MILAFDYALWTFFLSVFGFIGSLIFYFSVLREVQGGTVQDKILKRLDSIEKHLKNNPINQ